MHTFDVLHLFYVACYDHRSESICLSLLVVVLYVNILCVVYFPGCPDNCDVCSADTTAGLHCDLCSDFFLFNVDTGICEGKCIGLLLIRPHFVRPDYFHTSDGPFLFRPQYFQNVRDHFCFGHI